MAPVSKINLKDKVDDGEMDLSMCDLQDVPVKEIATYRKVYILDLSNNHLVQLPKNFPSLTNLTKLDLSKNKLTSLPDNFGDLIKLKHLDLYKNELQHLPLSFGNLKSLKWLDLKDNPLVPAIKETAGGCLDNKQCQTCAGKMVVFYKRLVEKVEAEKELREKQRQKDKLANEMAAQKLKQQEKKSIKKKSKVKVQADIPIHNEEPVEHKAKKEVVIKLVKSSSCISRIFLITFLMLFSIFISLFLLTSVKCKQTEIVEQKIVQYWGVFMDSLPLPIREFGVKSGIVVRVAHEYVGSQLLHLQKNEHVIYLLDKVKAMYGEVSSRLIRN